MLFNGSAQGLATLAATFCEPGDGVVVEALSFPFMVGYLAATGAEMTTVPVDDDGMDVDALEKAFDTFEERGIRPKLVLTIPTYQVPTGTCMPLRRREQLVDLIGRRGVVVVEDNCYYDIHYEKPPPPTLLSLDVSGLVVQSDSFSKILAPGLRMGWVAGIPEALAAVATARQDLGVSQWLARALELYVGDGRLDATSKNPPRRLPAQARHRSGRPARALRAVGAVPGPAGWNLLLARDVRRRGLGCGQGTGGPGRRGLPAGGALRR